MRKIYTKKEALKASLDYFKGKVLPAIVFVDKYALKDKDRNLLELTPTDAHKRVAKRLAEVESKYPNSLSEDEIFELYDGFKNLILQGSPFAGIGNDQSRQSIANCYSIGSPEDSYGGILQKDQELVQICKRRGGVGLSLSSIRPKGMKTNNAALTTDGIVAYARRYSNSIAEVAQSGGRRGAGMITCTVHHPQVLDFINMKRDTSKITGANISVELTDEFMRAVEADGEIILRFDSAAGEVF